jgi:L-arabinonolactonase
MEIVSAAKRENSLGESPMWDAAEKRLYWVDIGKQTLHWVNPALHDSGEWALPARATAIARRANGGMLLATEHGFATFDATVGRMTMATHLEPDRPWNRSNDGHADAFGRFWLGTMDDNETRRSGAIYRLDADWTCTRVLDGLGIPNGLVCTPDCRGLYVADSKDQVLYFYEIEPHSGSIGERRLFASTKDADCTPDGSALDAEGFLWNAQWGGWRVVRYAPNGEIDRIVPLPVEQPTSCAFGGDDLSVLYITTARRGLSAEALERQPLAGSVLSFHAGVPGLPTPMFGG